MIYYVRRIKHDDGYILLVQGPTVTVKANSYRDAAKRSGLPGQLSVNRKGDFFSRVVTC